MNRPLISKLRLLPKEPGVYLFKDKNGEIIYIGKAASLSNRVQSYFQKRPFLPKDLMLTSKIVDVDYIISNSEIEALILENNLIKTYQPKYNINLRDDKTYPLVKITTQEEFPGIYTTRKVMADGAKYFGPYTQSYNLQKTLKLIKEIFLIRGCRYKFTAKKQLKRPCLNFDIKRCCAPCSGNISQEEYQKIVQQVCLFLSGKVEEVIKELKIKMKDESQILRFEKSAIIRDQIYALQQIMTKQQAVSLSPVNQDVIGIANLPGHKQICALVLLIREGRLVGEEHYFLKIGVEELLTDVLTAFVKQYYSGKSTIPDELLLPAIIDEKELIQKWLEEKRGTPIKIYVPKRGQKKQLVALAIKNATLTLSLQKEDDNEILSSLQNYLKLHRLPVRIEAFDISCLSGKEAVGSLVVFESAKPKKSDYRRFKIKGQSSPDDIRMLTEIVTRRYTRLLNEKRQLPDLILIDGGIQQLNTASQVLSSLGLSNIPLISLSKPQSPDDKEKIWTSDTCFIPPKDSAILHLVQQIRDEAHRFAITYHRRIKRKATLNQK